jgi:hypothetical protein
VDRAGTLHGVETTNHRNLKLLPYVLGGFSQDFTLSDDRSELEGNVGLDLKYGLTPSLTLDGTLNTDFAQVEADDEQVNLTRFALFFPEKRPFFLENAGFFEFGSPREVELFFSRRIGLDGNREQVPIDAGLRVSGKMGSYQLGLLNMQTRRVEDAAPANNYGVARLSRELPNRSSIGVIGVSRQATSQFEDAPSSNRAFGADANIGLGQYANWFNYFSETRSPGLKGSDHAYSSRLEYVDSTHKLILGYLEVGHHFNPEVGFVQRLGFRQPTYSYRYTYYPESKWIRSISPHFRRNIWYTLGNNDMESDAQHYHLKSEFQDGGHWGIMWNRDFERLDQPFEISPGVEIPTGRYRFNSFIGHLASNPSARFFAEGWATIGDFYDGTIRGFDLDGGYRHSHNVAWTVSYVRNFVRLPAGNFNTDLVRLRFNWSFSPKSYLQTLSQYNSNTKLIGHNVRLAFLSTSSTGFFLVYNTRHLTSDFMDPHAIPRRTVGRALYAKFSYLFDY